MLDYLQDKAKQLSEEGKEIYSISKLNSYNTCPFMYYKTYVEGNRGIDNVYSYAGTVMHDTLEDIHNDKCDEGELIKSYNNFLLNTKLFGIEFPSKVIEDNWRKNMSHFVNSFKRLNVDMDTEKFFLLEILPNVYVRGYIDAMYTDAEDNFVILDWKTSSKFTGKKLTEAGRQLVIYKIAVERLLNKKVDKVGWYMLKYLHVVHGDKGKKKKRKMCERRSWVKECKSIINTQLRKLNYTADEIKDMLDIAIENNNLDNMPTVIQDRYQLEDCFVEYNITDEVEQETLDYIQSTVDKINADKHFYHTYIDDRSSFFCNNLCSHREQCEYIKIFNDTEDIFKANSTLPKKQPKQNKTRLSDKDMMKLFGN